MQHRTRAEIVIYFFAFGLNLNQFRVSVDALCPVCAQAAVSNASWSIMVSFFVRGALCPLLFVSCAWAGSYSGPTDLSHAIDPAIAADDVRIVQWANHIDGSRTQFAPVGSAAIDQTGGFNSLGELTSTDIAAGIEPGFLTVTFPGGIADDIGPDFAVFENGFVFGGADNLFAELAYVEVSSNGTDFARFPSVSSNTMPASGSGAFSSFDMTNVYNLAGKHAAGFGTPFDLGELTGDAAVMGGLIDLSDIQFVRLVDVPGSGDFFDSQGNPILDAWPTASSGGFDFRLGEGLGVGVLSVATVPEPGGVLLALASLLFVQARRRKRATFPSGLSSVASVNSVGILFAVCLALAGAPQRSNAQTVVDFEELTLFTAASDAGGGSYFNGNDGSGTTNSDGWSSMGLQFSNSYNGDSLPAFDFWGGWAYSNVSNTATAGFRNQYASFAGGGADEHGNVVAGENYAVAYLSGSYFDVPPGLRVSSIDVTNTTFAALSMLNGDTFARQFGGPTGDDPDLFEVAFAGYDSPGGTGNLVGSVSIPLADYRPMDNSLDFVADQWLTVDLSAIADSRSILLQFASTDTGGLGINTPTYVAVDNIRLVPEPGGLSMLGLAMTLSFGLRVRKRQN